MNALYLVSQSLQETLVLWCKSFYPQFEYLGSCNDDLPPDAPLRVHHPSWQPSSSCVHLHDHLRHDAHHDDQQTLEDTCPEEYPGAS